MYVKAKAISPGTIAHMTASIPRSVIAAANRIVRPIAASLGKDHDIVAPSATRSVTVSRSVNRNGHDNNNAEPNAFVKASIMGRLQKYARQQRTPTERNTYSHNILFRPAVK
jgi:hypothetical protein